MQMHMAAAFCPAHQTLQTLCLCHQPARLRGLDMAMLRVCHQGCAVQAEALNQACSTLLFRATFHDQSRIARPPASHCS